MRMDMHFPFSLAFDRFDLKTETIHVVHAYYVAVINGDIESRTFFPFPKKSTDQIVWKSEFSPRVNIGDLRSVGVT